MIAKADGHTNKPSKFKTSTSTSTSTLTHIKRLMKVKYESKKMKQENCYNSACEIRNYLRFQKIKHHSFKMHRH